MDMLQARLEQDEVTYQRLTSDNEDTDMYRAIMMRINAETAFQASLRANSGIIQMSLANFIG
jgi:flagellin-like hook-associated protein FlgL